MALQSVLDQSFQDYECLVVDDASDAAVDVDGIVSSFGDPRLRVLQRDDNGGPSQGLYTGYEAATGDYIIQIHSDWEYYPWTLARGCELLDGRTDVDIVCGLHVRSEDSRMFVRVRNSPRLVTPDDFRKQEPMPDRIAMVRSVVVEEWLRLPWRYFALEFHQWVTAELTHCQLALDEPWALYHTSGADRVTVNPEVGQRKLEDWVIFLRDRGDLIDGGPCRTLDVMLKQCYFVLRREKRSEAAMAADALRRRGIRPSRVLAEETAYRAARKLRLAHDPVVSWL